jgi:chemotaxis signal transduction protein
VPGGRLPLVGLAQFAGEPLPVLELLALAEDQIRVGGHDVTIVVNRADAVGPSFVGLAVQDALQVVSITDDAVDAVDRGAVVGVARIDADEVLVIDPARIGAQSPLGDGREPDVDGGIGGQ